MADPTQPPQPGFFSNLAGLLGFGPKPTEPDYAGPKPTGDPLDDYLTARQAGRFQKMTDEVKGLLKANPPGATGDNPSPDWTQVRRGLRQKGYDQKEEDAVMNVFIHEHGSAQGVMAARSRMPSYAEGQTIPYESPPDEPKQPENPQLKDLLRAPIAGLPEPTPDSWAVLGRGGRDAGQTLQRLYDAMKRTGKGGPAGTDI